MQVAMDFTYALRSLRKSPGTTAVAVVTLALGIGACTAVFSVIRAAVLDSRPLRALRDPAGLVMLWEKNPAMMAFIAQRLPAAPRNFQEWQTQSRSFTGMAAFEPLSCTVGAGGGPAGRPAEVEAMRVQQDFFSLLGVRPALGRAFTTEDARTARDRVVLLSGGFYRRRFGADPRLDGKTLRIDGIDRTVVGVLPETFEMPGMWEGTDQKKPQVWIPLDVSEPRGEPAVWQRAYFVYARLRPGVTLAQARSEMDVIGKRLAGQYPDTNRGFGVNVFSLRDEDAGPEMRRALLVLQCAVGFVLLIACANVANLLLARAVGREQEVAIRMALGAERSRIIRLVLTESVLLGVAGGAVGLLPAWWGLQALAALAPADIHAFRELRLDPFVLAFTFLLSVGTSVVFGLAPALHASGRSLNEALSQTARSVGSGPRWVRNSLVVGEVALAVVLLTGAGLMIRSIGSLMSIEPGFKTDRLLTLQATVLKAAGTRETDKGRLRAFCDQLLDRVAALPGVQDASASSGLPMESVSQTNYNLEGVAKTRDWLIANVTSVSETFFRTMQIPLRRGRWFTRAEASAERQGAIIVSESFARESWPHEDPLTKAVLMPNGNAPDLRLPVIGVVGDTRQMGPDNDIKPEMYLPSRAYSEINLAVRTAGDPMSLAPLLEKTVGTIQPPATLGQTRAMKDVLRNWPAERRFLMSVLGAFAGVALALACIGLYGVLAYLVTLRTREMGVRMALGADARNVFGLVVGQGVRLAAAGIALGIGGALLLTRVMTSMLFGVSPTDPATLVAVAAALGGAALLASYFPARRAVRISPIQALRAE